MPAATTRNRRAAAKPADDVPAEKGRRADIEDILTDHGIPINLVRDVPTSEFDIDASLHNQVRTEPIDESTRDTYADALRRGARMPGIVAWRPGGSRHARRKIIDGVHRAAAAIEVDQPVDVYEVPSTTDPRTVTKLAIMLNTTHGLRLTIPDRVRHAIWLKDGGSTSEEACAVTGLAGSTFARALRLRDAENRARKTKVLLTFSGLTADAQYRLMQIKTDEGFKEAVEVAAKAELKGSEVQAYVGQINRSTSGETQRKLARAGLVTYADRIEGTSGGRISSNAKDAKRGPSLRQQVGLALTGVDALPDDDDVLVLTFRDMERGEWAKRCAAGAKRLTRLQRALAAASNS